MVDTERTNGVLPFINIERSFDLPLPYLDSLNHNEIVWKRQLEGWFNVQGIHDLKIQFEVILKSIKFQDIIEELIDMEQLEGRPLTLEECMPTIKRRVSYQNDKKNKLRQIKMILIYPNETVESFNKRFLNLYYSLGTEYQIFISFYDYLNAVRNRPDLFQVLTLKEPKSIEEACEIAKNWEQWQEYNRLNFGQSLSNYNSYRMPPSNAYFNNYQTITPTENVYAGQEPSGYAQENKDHLNY